MPPPFKTISSRQEGITYTERQAVRVVAFNGACEIALIYAERDKYYKLPGGGIDAGENHLVAVEREMMEETGASIKVRQAGCVATTEEYRNDLHQFSYCYVADLIDGSGSPNLTEDEIEDGLKHQWLSVEEAKKRMAAAEPTSLLGRFIKEREIFLLEEAINGHITR